MSPGSRGNGRHPGPRGWLRPAAGLLALVAAAGATPPARAADPADPVDFLTLSIPVDGSVLALRALDLDGDGRQDLVLAVAPGGGRKREVRLYRGQPDGLVALVPDRVVSVLDDVIAWSAADTRPEEPGLELVFLTRTGAFDYATTRAGYKDNIRRLATADLILQVPSPRQLPFLDYVLPAPGGDRLLLPAAVHPELWGPAGPARPKAGSRGPADLPSDPPSGPASESPGDAWVRLSDIETGRSDSLFSTDAPEAVVEGRGQRRVTINTGLGDDETWIADDVFAFAAMLQAETRYRAPARLDVDGDGWPDLLLLKDRSLRLWLGTPDGLPSEPTRAEKLPDWIPDDGSLVIVPRDLDGDGDLDLQIRSSPKTRDIDAIVFTYFLLLNDGTRLLPDQPSQVLRFEGNGTDSEMADVDGDGRKDLVLTKYVAPGLKQLVTGLRFERSAYVYLAGGRGGEPFERKPSLRDEQAFTIDTLQDALVLRRVPGDMSGDGLADLLEVDLTGRLTIRRITRDSGLFGGGGLVLDPTPWKRFELRGRFDRVLLEDFNADGLVDVVVPDEDSVGLLLSRRAGRSQP